MSVTVTAANFEGRGFTDLSALDIVLDELDAKFRAEEDPTLVTVAESPERRIAIAVGGDESVVSLTDDADGYYLSANGKPDDGTTVWFSIGNTVSEFSANNVVPTAEARDAVRRFFVTRRLPDNIEWEAVG
jgi:Immunity protein Imm1